MYLHLAEHEKGLQELARQTQRNVKANKAMINHSLAISYQYLKIYQPSLGTAGSNETGLPIQTPEANEKFERDTAKREIVEKYQQILTDMCPAITLELDLLQEKISKTTDEILSMIKKIRKNAKTREMDLIDIERHQSSLNKLNNSELTAKTEEHKLALEEKLERATEKYNRINDMMKRELPYFYKMIGQVMVPLTDIIFWSFDVISYQNYKTLSLMKGDFGIVTDNFDETYAELVLQEYTKKSYELSVQIQKLSIVNFSRTYVHNLASPKHHEDHASLPSVGDDPIDLEADQEKPFQTFATNTGVIDNTHRDSLTEDTNDLKVLYDFESQRHGDLQLTKGETILCLEKSDDQWWKGRNSKGEEGVFPANYVEQL